MSYLAYFHTPALRLPGCRLDPDTTQGAISSPHTPPQLSDLSELQNHLEGWSEPRPLAPPPPHLLIQQVEPKNMHF